MRLAYRPLRETSNQGDGGWTTDWSSVRVSSFQQRQIHDYVTAFGAAAAGFCHGSISRPNEDCVFTVSCGKKGTLHCGWWCSVASTTFFYPYGYHMVLCNESYSSSRPAGCLPWQNFNVVHYTQAFQPNFYILAILKDTIGYYNFLTFINLDFDQRSQGQHKPNLLVSLSHTLFN